MSVYNSIPHQCGCNTASKAPCNNNMKFIYKFNNGHCKFSCGIHAHVNSVYAALDIQDYILFLKKSNNSINTFDVVMTPKSPCVLDLCLMSTAGHGGRVRSRSCLTIPIDRLGAL